ncbi:MAG: signal peptide peptidase SppA [Bdellovibrionaceae bacterium]|nr:signal peptide peptidase SppA [Pseudobdellovibrionaceae bacterium]MDW8189825.1 signal peptide peptidase SppA [Pseudobdellovibrionaceae bacterium]
MGKKKSWLHFFIIMIVFVGLGFFLANRSSINPLQPTALLQPHILVHELKGVILGNRKWMEQVEPYVRKFNIKAVVFIVNSPGGVVGPSQELYEFLRRIRTELKKPVVVFSSHVLASGAYYMALGADKIVVNPGTLVGSIGVILEFLNLEGLYHFAKIQRYSITSGKYKDSGAEYRSMREDEKRLFNDLVMNVYQQFANTVKETRGLSDEELSQVADGRVFSGDQALQAKLIDSTGTLDTAIKLAAEAANLSHYELFYIPKEEPSIFDLFFRKEEFETGEEAWQQAINFVRLKLRPSLSGLPLFLLPGVMETHWIE